MDLTWENSEAPFIQKTTGLRDLRTALKELTGKDQDLYVDFTSESEYTMKMVAQICEQYDLDQTFWTPEQMARTQSWAGVKLVHQGPKLADNTVHWICHYYSLYLQQDGITLQVLLKLLNSKRQPEYTITFEFNHDSLLLLAFVPPGYTGFQIEQRCTFFPDWNYYKVTGRILLSQNVLRLLLQPQNELAASAATTDDLLAWSNCACAELHLIARYL